MENISGNMEETVKESSIPSKKKVSVDKGWTILMIGANGETKRLRGFKKLVFSGVLICLLSISATLFVIQMYLNLLNENKKLKETISISESLYGGLNLKKKKTPDAIKSPFIVKSDIFRQCYNIIDYKDPFKYKNHPDLNYKKSLNFMPPLKSEKQTFRSYSRLNRMMVEDFKLVLKPEKNAIGMSFVLRNKKNAKKAMAGTTFVVLKNNFEEETWISFPDVKLRKGRPAIFRKGKSFYVARFKTIRHKPVVIENPEIYNKASVFVYSSKGRLLVDKTFPIEMML